MLERKVHHLCQSLFTKTKPASPAILQKERRRKKQWYFVASCWEWAYFVSSLWCSYSQFCEAVTARCNVWETEMKKMEIHTLLVMVCVCVWRGIGLDMCLCVRVCMNLCTCMCVMSQCVTGSRLSPSLHPDSSVKQGLIWSVYVFENMCVCVSGLIVFLFFFLALFTSGPSGVPGSCLMDSLALLSWPLAWALSWTPN